MKYVLMLIILLSLIFHAQCYSQKNPRLRIKQENSKGFSLKVKDLKAIEKDGKTSWAVTSVFTNHSRDTLLYFSYPGCEATNFGAIATDETITLFPEVDKCDTPVKQTVIVLPPSQQRTVDLVISSKQPVNSSFAFKVLLWIHRAKNKSERIPEKYLLNEAEREILLASNLIKIKSAEK
jgi:hypothetical protein